MALFSFSKGADRVGAIITVGSGSVLVAIILSKEHELEPVIIWSHREHAPLRNIESIDQSAKAVLTALINALLQFDVEGRQALHAYNKHLKLSEVLCFISAPWSYTVTKCINYAQEKEFEVTSSLIDELIHTAQQKITVELGENESVSQLGLTIITRITMDVLANGYRIKDPAGGKAKELTLSHASVVTQKYLVDELENLRQKVFAGTTLHKLSQILAFYIVSKDLIPTNFDTCLIDITYEATEIGVVRDGTLQYSTHTPFGAFSLAREISQITSVTLYEAFQCLHTETPYDFMASLPEQQRRDVNQVFEAYVGRLVDLFRETGDELSIPKHIFLHTDLRSEPLFRDLVEKAAKQAIKADPIIVMTTEAVLTTAFPKLAQKRNTADFATDTGMLLSALFFHKRNHVASFEYL